MSYSLEQFFANHPVIASFLIGGIVLLSLLIFLTLLLKLGENEWFNIALTVFLIWGFFSFVAYKTMADIYSTTGNAINYEKIEDKE